MTVRKYIAMADFLRLEASIDRPGTRFGMIDEVDSSLCYVIEEFWPSFDRDPRNGKKIRRPDGTFYMSAEQICRNILGISLTELVANASTTPYGLRIFDFVDDADEYDQTVPPKSLDYGRGLTTRLSCLREYNPDNKGEVMRCVWFASYDPSRDEPYQTPVVQEDHIYQRSAETGLAQVRTLSISWFRNDGKLHPSSKRRIKVYNPSEAISEGVNRRRHLINLVKTNTIGLLVRLMSEGTLVGPTTATEVLDLARDFVSLHRAVIADFIEGGTRDILYDLADDALTPWLDLTPDGSAGDMRSIVSGYLDVWS